MLYDAYEMQRSMLAGASALANFGAGLLQNPANPFAYFGGGAIMGSALEVFAHASAPRGKPAFGLTKTVVDGREVVVHEEIVARKPFGQLKRFRREGAQPLHRGRRAIEGRRRRLGIDPMADLHQLAGADQPTQDPAYLIIAAQIVEVVAQKHVPPCASEALDDTVFQIFRLHSLSHPSVSQYDIISHTQQENQPFL